MRVLSYDNITIAKVRIAESLVGVNPAGLCKMSKDQKRISATEKPVDNERYAFRCFLLRLGFIGDEYKTDRKILMRYLPGNSAFKGGEGHAISK